MRTLGRALTLLTMLALSSAALQAQTTVELLTSATETTPPGSAPYYSGSPINTWYHDQRWQAIYMASDLTAAGIPSGAMISALQLKAISTPGTDVLNFRIRMAHTTATTITAWQTTGLTAVYGPTTISAGAFSSGAWYAFTFSSSFQWNGTSNLIIEWTTDGTTYVSGGGSYVRTTTGTRSVYGYSDSGYTWPFDSMTAYTTTSVPSMRVTFTNPGPYISVTSATNPLALGTTSQGTPSTPVSYTVTGGSLTGNVTVTAPTGVQLSITGSGGTYASSHVLTPTSGSLNQTVHVRMTGASAGSISGNITHSGGGATTVNLAVTGTVNPPPPVITVTSPTTPLSLGTTSQGVAGTPASYTVSGVNLTANVFVSAPAGVEVSVTAGSGYATSIQLTQTGGTLATTTVYARISASATQGAISGNLAHTTTGGTPVNLAVTGTVTAPVPTITVSAGTPPLNLGSVVVGSAGTPVAYTVTGANLTADIVVTAPTGVEISQTGAGGTYAGTQNLVPTGGSVNATIHARLIGATVGAVSGDITHTSTGATQQNLAVTGTVTPPPPSITITGVTPPLNLGTVFQGNAGTPQSYTVTGANLTANITVTAPAGVEVSQTGAGGTYATTQALVPTAGSVNATIHARLTGATVGAVSGNITHVSTTASQNVAVTGTVNPNLPNMEVARGGAIADGGTDALGNVPFGAAQTLTYTISNTGTLGLNLTGAPNLVVITPVNNCTASVTAAPASASVAVGGSVTFTVGYNVAAAGAFSFTVSIANDDPGTGKNPYNWTVSGTGVSAPVIGVTRGSAIADGGNHAIGTVGTVQALPFTFTVSNTGNAPLALNGTPEVAISGMTNCIAQVTGTPATSVAVSGSTTFTISVRALASGPMSFQVSIANNDIGTGKNPFNFTVDGIGAGGLTAGGGTGGGNACSAQQDHTVGYAALLLAALTLLSVRALKRRLV